MLGKMRIAGEAVIGAIEAVNLDKQEPLHPSKICIKPDFARNPDAFKISSHLQTRKSRNSTTRRLIS